ncbi:MAG: hypothetical protein AAGG56_11640 [Pseudomonadota bacterium]
MSIAATIGATANVSAQEFGSTGAEVYEETCNKCHGLITQESSWLDYLSDDGSEVQLAVILARGPTLNGIVNRPVAIIEGYKYSNAMKEFAATGAIWDRETLDRYITDSRAMIKGYMVLKLGEADRNLVLDYLTSVALYQE